MKNKKLVSTPLASHLKLRKFVPRHRRIQVRLFINIFELDVCNGFHKTRYCTCSRSCEKVYEQYR
jgi:hypothetical protein